MARAPLTVAAVTDRLAAAGCVAAHEEATELLAAAADENTLAEFVSRRERGEPLAWITGSVLFCGHRVMVGPGVYVPRVQTEDTARQAGDLLAARGREGRAADLCSGSGAVAVHLMAAAPSAGVVALDIDQHAASCARRNGVLAIVGDLGAPLARGAFDVVTVVAPYVPTDEIEFLPADVQRYEPRHALDGGSDGLDLVRRAVASAAELLRAGGWFLTELGGNQDRLLVPTLDSAGFEAVATWFDEEGDLRGLAARRSV